MADLDDVATAFRAQHNRRMRVATKYVNLTRNFFAAHGVVDYRIVESAGATEGAPAVRRRRTDRRHHHDRRDARRQRPQGHRRRHDPALAGQSGRGARCRLERARRARPRASSSTRSPPAPAPAPSARCARAFRAATRRCCTRRATRFGVVSPFGGPTSSGMLTLHCPPAQLYALASFLRAARRAERLGRLARLRVRPRQSAVRPARGVSGGAEARLATATWRQRA